MTPICEGFTGSCLKRLMMGVRPLKKIHPYGCKTSQAKIENRDRHGKSRNGHGKAMEIYFVKSVEL